MLIDVLLFVSGFVVGGAIALGFYAWVYLREFRFYKAQLVDIRSQFDELAARYKALVAKGRER